MAGKKIAKMKLKHPHLRKLVAGISLIMVSVVLLGGLMAGARIFTIVLRTAVVLLFVNVISRIFMRVIDSYEEMNSGEA